ncbi:MAG: hypothetical protein ACOCWR_02500 [Oceanidesulfovibrio sp.]
MEPILKWQYDHMVKELLLLQEHASDPSCPCETGGEMCVRKHLMTIEAYAEETTPMEGDEKRSELLQRIGDEARTHRLREEDALCGKDVPPDLTDWSREWRKRFESLSLACENAESDSSGESECRESCPAGNS